MRTFYFTVGLTVGIIGAAALCAWTENKAEERFKMSEMLRENYRGELNEERTRRVCAEIRISEMNNILMTQKIHWWLIPADATDGERIPAQNVPVN